MSSTVEQNPGLKTCLHRETGLEMTAATGRSLSFRTLRCIIVIVFSARRILPYLIFFVILSNPEVIGAANATVFTVSQVVYVVRDPIYPLSWQHGYAVAEGLEFDLGGSFFTGFSGMISITADSPVYDGFVYRGYAALSGGLYLGYESRRFGIAAAAEANYAQYMGTNLYFFYPALALTPFLAVPLEASSFIRLSTPVRVSLRRDLIYHIGVGVSITVLLL